MAYLYNDATPDYHFATSSPVSAMPVGMAAWAYSDDAANSQTVLCLCDASADLTVMRLGFMGAVGGDPLRAQLIQTTGTTVTADSSVGYSVNTWTHVAGAFGVNDADSGKRDATVWKDGGGSGSDSQSQTFNMALLDRLAVGNTARLTPFHPFSGRIAEPAVWDLTAWGSTNAERVAAFGVAAAMMARGASPLLFPRGLAFYRDLVRTLNRPGIGPTLFASGSPSVATHPRVRHPSGATVGRGAASPVAGPPYRLAAAGLYAADPPRGVHLPRDEAGGAYVPGPVAGGVFPHQPSITEEPC